MDSYYYIVLSNDTLIYLDKSNQVQRIEYYPKDKRHVYIGNGRPDVINRANKRDIEVDNSMYGSKNYVRIYANNIFAAKLHRQTRDFSVSNTELIEDYHKMLERKRERPCKKRKRALKIIKIEDTSSESESCSVEEDLYRFFD